MKRPFIEKLLAILAWMMLIGGILFGFLVSKGILESQKEMCVPEAIVFFIGAVFASICAWALFLEVAKISERLRNIEDRMSKTDK